MVQRKRTGPTPISALRHGDERTNIPTGELAEFVADDERRPTWITYPRDPSVSPQLVWVGKEEQDTDDLAVPAPPVYIQEKIHPQIIIENLRRTAREDGVEPGLTLFDDFRDDLPFEEKVDFYAHQQGWANRLILGDSLHVMASLAEKERLRGKVQMVYLDPPYGIKFGSNWQVSTRDRDVRDGKDTDLVRQPEQIKAFRDTWELGVHSYLTYLRDRLTVARDLLTDSGSLFVQIGDGNVHLVRNLLDEVFGADNFVSLVTFAKTSGFQSSALSGSADYLVWYARSRDALKYRPSLAPRTLADDVGRRYTRIELPDGTRRVMTSEERANPATLPDGSRVYRHDNLASQGVSSEGSVPFEFHGRTFYPPRGSHWKTTAEGLRRLASAHRLAAPTQRSLAYVRFLDDSPASPRSNIWTDTQTGAFTDPKTYVVQTNTKVIQRCMLMTTDPGDLVMDPTCGSGTTAVVAEEWGRRWITIDTSRVALALARTRLMAARYLFYLLTDSP